MGFIDQSTGSHQIGPCRPGGDQDRGPDQDVSGENPDPALQSEGLTATNKAKGAATDCSTIFHLPLHPAENSIPSPSMTPRMLVTSSSRPRINKVIQTCTPLLMVIRLAGSAAIRG